MALSIRVTAIFDLSGRTALITGSSQGIGYALAGGLAAAGAQIVLNGRDGAKLGAAADRLKEMGASIDQSPFDATDHDAARTAIDGFSLSSRQRPS